MLHSEVPVFRRASGQHDCPECGGNATIQHYRVKVYGHYCVKKDVMLYWTVIPKLVFLSLSALLELRTGDGTENG